MKKSSGNWEIIKLYSLLAVFPSSVQVRGADGFPKRDSVGSVSYTHLTLPTKA